MSEMILLHTAQLSGRALDWAVAQAVGLELQTLPPHYGVPWRLFNTGKVWRPSTDWLCGGPLIEQYQITIFYHSGLPRSPLACSQSMHPASQSGDTILIAACRAIVDSLIGETVSIPAYLVESPVTEANPIVRIRRFEMNTAGRDFAIGDIHGHFSLVQTALHAAGFNPAVDRLFSVGDLVDRGPESGDALEWLDQPWFHAVR